MIRSLEWNSECKCSLDMVAYCNSVMDVYMCMIMYLMM